MHKIVLQAAGRRCSLLQKQIKIGVPSLFRSETQQRWEEKKKPKQGKTKQWDSLLRICKQIFREKMPGL